MQQQEKVIRALNTLNIPFKLHSHNPVRTVAEAAEVWSDIPGVHCKNLFFRDQKGKQHFLIVMEQSKQLDIKQLGLQINSPKLSFASEKRLQKCLGLLPGAVSPFGLINDELKHVHVFIDEDLRNSKFINFHPNENTATVTVSFEDFEKFMSSTGNLNRFIKI